MFKTAWIILLLLPAILVFTLDETNYLLKNQLEFQQRSIQSTNKIKEIETLEKKGGMVIPEGTVVYNATGRNWKAHITSVASSSIFGVYTPQQDTKFANLDHYTFDAGMFGRSSISSPEYFEVKCPRGSVFINIKKGYAQYLSMVPGNIEYSPDGQEIFNIRLAKYRTDEAQEAFNKRTPFYIFSAMSPTRYDEATGFNLSVDFDPYNFYPPKNTWRGGGKYFYTIYTNLNYYCGYNYFIIDEIQKSKRPIQFVGFYDFKVNVNKDYPGFLFVIGIDLFFGDVFYDRDDARKDQPVYCYLGELDSYLWKNEKNWQFDDGNYVTSIWLDELVTYMGIPSSYHQPYAYLPNINVYHDKQFWLDIYRIRSNIVLKRIWLNKIGLEDKLLDYAQAHSPRKDISMPRLSWYKFLGDDKEGRLYLEIGLDWPEYDFVPLILTIDREGKIYRIVRLWSAVDDKLAVEQTAKVGPQFYEYRLGILPDGSLISVWNDSNGVGIGKVE